MRLGQCHQAVGSAGAWLLDRYSPTRPCPGVRVRRMRWSGGGRLPGSGRLTRFMAGPLPKARYVLKADAVFRAVLGLLLVVGAPAVLTGSVLFAQTAGVLLLGLGFGPARSRGCWIVGGAAGHGRKCSGEPGGYDCDLRLAVLKWRRRGLHRDASGSRRGFGAACVWRVQRALLGAVKGHEVRMRRVAQSDATGQERASQRLFHIFVSAQWGLIRTATERSFGGRLICVHFAVSSHPVTVRAGCQMPDAHGRLDVIAHPLEYALRRSQRICCNSVIILCLLRPAGTRPVNR